MFTGLVEEVGVVRRVERRSEAARLVIGAKRVLDGTRTGDSIAVGGVCLTVTTVGREEFAADCMSETLSRTTLAKATTGVEVNLERSLAVGARLGGHLVLGHVDAVTRVLSVETKGEAVEVKLALPAVVAPFLAEKGSVALDGVSLTVIGVDATEFSVGLVPHTISATTLRSIAEGSSLNVEADVLARYVHRSLLVMAGMSRADVTAAEGLTLELLRDKGFV
jgi:riboflavin synthase